MTASYPKKLGGEATLETRPRVLNIQLGRRAFDKLGQEQRRALALFRAADFASEPHAVEALLSAVDDGRGLDTLKIGKRQVQQLAETVRNRGYPLTDEGIRAFKMERGFSEAVRIGPNVAEAYARFLDGREARLNVTREDWAQLAPELRRAIRVLMRIGRTPERLVAVRGALGIEDRPGDRTLLVGTVSGEALIRWARSLGLRFDREGFRQFRKAVQDMPGEVDENLLTFVTESILAPGEPAHDYERVSRDGLVLNKRTVRMLSAAKRAVRGEVKLGVMKGSYLAEERGAHPHQGGGAVDLSVRPFDGVDYAISALRSAGFAAWYRSRGERHHVHAVAIGDRQLCPAAEWQVKSFLSGLDGRTRGARDPHQDLEWQQPEWVRKYGVRYL
ncbi:MAG: hypothetical protein AAFQ82_17550 [Myxococcota bacterium]